MTKADWSEAENEAIVADYFAMLGEEIEGRSYNKAGHNRKLREEVERDRGAIEMKHCNISAVLQGLGEVWIDGYKPAGHLQAALVTTVRRWLEKHPDWPALPPKPDVAARLRAAPHGSPAREQLAELAESVLQLGPSPLQRNTPPPNDLEKLRLIAQTYDVAGRDARNRLLGQAGEERVLLHEEIRLKAAGRGDLASRIRWVSHLDGDGAGYDIHSFDANGRDRLIEVKTTNGWERTPFFISPHELEVSEEKENWLLLRVWNFARAPKGFELRPPLDAHVSLMATGYRAELL
ncbi:MAG: DUF3883 domain-containing protein [Alphaproteobacteria bacterium]|nr:DUF3883 domain-containing protein [Alphaproteobacteria bacterium]